MSPPLPRSSRGAVSSPPTEAAIRSDPSLSPGQKEALLAVYRSYVRQQEEAQDSA